MLVAAAAGAAVSSAAARGTAAAAAGPGPPGGWGGAAGIAQAGWEGAVAGGERVVFEAGWLETQALSPS